MDEQSSDDNQEIAQADNNEQIKSNGEVQEELNVVSSEDPSSKKNSELDVEKDPASDEFLQGMGKNITGEINAAALDDVAHEKHQELPQDSVPLASDVHATGDDAKSCWKMVLHEEYNSYYYWNTLTGETSWEIPSDFAQVTAVTSEPQTSVADDNANGNIHPSSGTGCANEVSYTLFPSESQIAQSIQECKEDESQFTSASGAIVGLHQGNVTLGNYASYVPPSASYVPQSVPVAGSWFAASGASNIYMHGAVTNNQDETAAADLPSYLVRRSESLLEKLRSLRGFEGNSNQEHAWTSKYIMEIEIRLFDLKSLLSCGSSLAPFWLHSERQLKRLEDAINSEIGSYVESELKNEISTVNLPSYEGGEAKQENMEGEADLDEDLKTAVISSEKPSTELPDVKLPSNVQSSLPDGPSDNDIASAKEGPGPVLDGTQVREEKNTSDEATVLANVNPVPEPHSVEEVDMDVDMEVEDTSLPSDATEAVDNHTFPSEQLAQPSSLADWQSVASGDESFAPPPGEDWIPPPPPDNEEIPPPPPDEPPEPFCPPLPPSYPEAVQSVTYNANYGLTYPDPNYSYYGHAGVAVPNQQVYYEGVPSSHSEVVAALNNPVGSMVYYGLQNAGAPVVAAGASSSFQAASAPSGYDTISSNLAGGISAPAEIGSLQNTSADAYALYGGVEPITNQASTTSTSASACAAIKETVSASSASISASSVALTAPSTVSDSSVAAAKPQSKASRVKKRTVAVASSLRSNKKVSSLVDKWKAAKEELEEAEEEEPENALTILEKKRQREIEQWRAQQISSGEAKENANFQPLGGDWRARVKRKRAQKAASGEAPVEETVAQSKQPDLTDHNKGLPHGWQAYWDDSSKQVYYGNTITSETTWTRPT